ncbi:putative restriction endonuclease [Pseudonocardia autotrophica]|uniref:Putative restriction endonuclease domain-containing protein n=2 Tax=Pseudonocardia TaxID=1847 RepID=A0A1Y2MZ42_PSEAH|nr:hypothetical protein BG845_02734 [Pseudonocardia autotrophica]TDN72339.1 putative restriction endonuclease [Pseudonocardia autotrophica]BBG03050.1 hypothetical protein Pdca_42590 [Pseudonocardia autotrophica]GEC23672.1 hypothetical protein PSA01_07010 [Pseudonocardia saturnea]
MSPSPGSPHRKLSFRLCYLFERARPDDLDVFEAVNVRLGPDRILIPDLAVVDAGPGIDPDAVVWEARHVRLVVGINTAIDRANRQSTADQVKPALYAAAGIGHLLRIDLTAAGPDATGYALRDGRWVETARARPGEELVLDAPVPLTTNLAALLAARRLPG